MVIEKHYDEQGLEIEYCSLKIVHSKHRNLEIATIQFNIEEDFKDIEELINRKLKVLLRDMEGIDCRKVNVCSSCVCRKLKKDETHCYICERKVCTYTDDVCSICMDKEDIENVWSVITSCNHVFHSHCLNKLTSQKHPIFCPMCRTEPGIHSIKTL